MVRIWKFIVIIALVHQNAMAETTRKMAKPEGTLENLVYDATPYKGKKPFGLRSSVLFANSDSGKTNVVGNTLSCLGDVATGIWNASVGNVSNAAAIVMNPAQAWEDGHAAFNGMYEFLTDIETNMQEMLGDLSQIDSSTVATIVCTMVGELGVDAVITYLARGQNSQALMVRALGYLHKILALKKIIKVAGLSGSLPQTRGRLNDLIKRYMRSGETRLPADNQNAMEVYADLQQADMALDSLECALP